MIGNFWLAIALVFRWAEMKIELQNWIFSARPLPKNYQFLVQVKFLPRTFILLLVMLWII